MRSPRSQPESFLPLSQPVFHILVAVADRQRHGYAIMKEVNRATDGAVKLSTGTLYAAIRRLLDDGLVEESDERPDDELDDKRRRYYRLTELGHAVVLREADRMAELVTLARGKALATSSGNSPRRS